MTALNDTDDLLLPAGTRLLHIGPQKTGTTAIQVALNRSREELRRHGVVFPGKSTRPRLAVWSLLGTPDGRPQPRIAHWEGLVREVEQAGDLRVCISTEDWARTDLDGAKQVVSGLGGERAHVVATARRLDKLLPSQWQQRVKMRRTTLTYEQWLEVVLGDKTDDPVWQNVWVPHDIKTLVDRWTAAAGSRDRFTLLVADESDRGFLPRSFEQMLGLPEGLLNLAETEVLNQSRGIGRIEVIRHLSIAFDRNDWPEDVSRPEGPLRVRLTDELKTAAPWPDELSVPTLPAWAAERVAELSAERAELVKSLDIRVIGDPDNLRMPPSLVDAAPDDQPIMVSSELAARAVEVTIHAALERGHELIAKRDREIQRLRKRVARLRSRQGGAASTNGQARGIDEVSARELAAVLGQRGVQRLRRLRRRR
jgi:hypothetical protein